MKIVKVRDVKTPVRGTDRSAGIDFFVPNDYPRNTFLQKGQSIRIATGIHAKVPHGFALVALNKSGVAVNKGLAVGACVIDEDYQGEIFMHLYNTSHFVAKIEPGEKLIQMLLIPVDYQGIEVVESKDALYKEVTQRGEGALGSTGTH